MNLTYYYYDYYVTNEDNGTTYKLTEGVLIPVQMIQAPIPIQTIPPTQTIQAKSKRKREEKRTTEELNEAKKRQNEHERCEYYFLIWALETHGYSIKRGKVRRQGKNVIEPIESIWYNSQCIIRRGDVENDISTRLSQYGPNNRRYVKRYTDIWFVNWMIEMIGQFAKVETKMKKNNVLFKGMEQKKTLISAEIDGIMFHDDDIVNKGKEF